MKKNLILSLVLSNCMFSAWAQNLPSSTSGLLKATSKKLSELTIVNYDYSREINNPKNNYYNKSKANCFIDFNTNKNQIFSRFQLTGDDFAQIYNGSEYFSLSKKEKTIEIIEQPNQTSFKDFSFFYNSLPTLKNNLDQIIDDETVGKFVKDTTISNTTYNLIKLVLPNKSIGILGYNKFSIDLTIFYDIIIDLKSGLPYQIIEHNSRDKDQYYVKTTFTNVNIAPEIPSEFSWYYSTYQKEYQTKNKEEFNPLITIGNEIGDWTLPIVNKKKNVSAADFKDKIVMMDFWIKNCGPCMESFPFLKKLQEKYGDKNFKLLTVNAYEHQKEVDFFYKRENPKYLMLYNGQQLAKKLGVGAYPSIIILGKDGKVIYSELGFDKEKVEQIIRENL